MHERASAECRIDTPCLEMPVEGGGGGRLRNFKEEQQAEEKRAFERMALTELYEENGGEVWTITNNWCVQGGGVRCMESQPMRNAEGGASGPGPTQGPPSRPNIQYVHVQNAKPAEAGIGGACNPASASKTPRFSSACH
jgi:hypothetical protein